MAELKDRYAAALYELSAESGRIEDNLKGAAYVLDALKVGGSEEFLRHPHIPREAKKELLSSLFEGKLSLELMGFLYMAADRRREAMIVPALTEFADRVNRELGRVTASVVSAAPLTEKQLETLRETLSRKLQKQVEIRHSVDPALLGGFYVHADGRLIDSSVRFELKKLKESMEGGKA